MIRGEQAINADVVEFIRLGNLVCLDYRVDVGNRATFDAAMRRIRGCNSFDPGRVARAIGEIFDDAMAVEFGAEGSPVLYVTVPFYAGQRIGASCGVREKYTLEQRQEYAGRVIDWAKHMDADEICVYQHPRTEQPIWNGTGDHPYRVRIWWD